MTTQRFIERRLRNIIGESELDDANTKTFMRLIETQMDVLFKSRDPGDIAYSQGYVAALRQAIEEVRRNNRKLIVEEEDDNS